MKTDPNLELHVRANVLPCMWVIEQVQDGGHQSLIDATELAVDYILQDGAETTPLGHNLRVLQCCTHKHGHSWGQRTHSRIDMLQFTDQSANLPSSQIMAMQARTIRSRSCSPSLPTAMSEFVIELGKSRAFTVIIWKIIVKTIIPTLPSMTKRTLNIVKEMAQCTLWEHNGLLRS